MGVLEGKAVVITGAGRGLGEAYARLAAREGARVVVNDVDDAAAESVAVAIRAGGGSAIKYVADVASWSEAEALVGFCVGKFGALDGFVNNAALFHLARVEEETEARLRRIVEVNVLGSAFCAVHALRQMLRQGSGSLVNVTSGSHAGSTARFAYGATKGAVASMTYALAVDAAGTRVRVNAISPIGATRMIDTNRDYHRGNAEKLKQLEKGAGAIAPESNAPPVIYLLSDLAKDVQGQVVRIQGRSLTLMTHPGALYPDVERDSWTVQDVARAFETRFARQQLPLGVHPYEVKVHA